jgi:ATP-binding cassette subfamily B protein/subfamily B ATP-binding cassette protein MsbA
MAGHLTSLKRLSESIDIKPRDTWTTIRRLSAYLRPYAVRFMVGMVFVLLAAVTFSLGPILIGRGVDAVVRLDSRGLWVSLVGLLVFYIFNFIATREQIRRIGVVGQYALADVRARIFAKVQELPVAFFDRAEAGDLMSRLVNDVDTLNVFLGQGFAQLIGGAFSLAGVLIAMTALDWRLTLATLTVVPAMLITTRFFGLMARRRFRATRETIGDVSANLQEELAAIRVTQAFGREELNLERFEERNRANRDANIQAQAVSSAFTPALDVLSAVTTAIVAGYGGWLAFSGQMSVGVVVSFLTFSQGFFRQISQISSIYATAQAALAGAERIFELLDMPVDLTDKPDASEMPPIEGRITFDDVSFEYAAGAPVLTGVSFEIQPGTTVALVGPTGAGKTSIINLLVRFYDVRSGAVLIDGIDVRDVTRASLRGQMGVVLQEPFLFAGTVADNIRYGRLDATDEEIAAAARLVNAHDFIANLPEAYATPLGERGGGLSAGQRQLIAFARAIIADPRILILDEATASVDTRTEVLIQRALAALLKGRTSVVIAHRLSTIREADEILVVDEGRIVERGTHQELMSAGGLYRELYERQFGGA